MSFHGDFYDYCQTKSAITDLIGTRMFWQVSLDATFPYTVGHFRDTERAQSNSGESGKITRSVVLAHFGSTFNSAFNVAEAFRGVLAGLSRTTMGSTVISSIHLSGESTLLEPLHFAEQDAPHAFTQEYTVTYTEST